jgi:hypothetical protein
MSTEINNEKTKLNHAIEYINDFGCSLDDTLEKMEEDLKTLTTVLPFTSVIAKNYTESIEKLTSDLINGEISQIEYKIGKSIAEKVGLEIKNKNEELIKKVNALNIRIYAYKEIVSKLKQDFDAKNNRIKSLESFEETQKAVEENKMNEKQLLIRRPLGVHPGNPLAARRAQIQPAEEVVVKKEEPKIIESVAEEVKVKKTPGRKKKE